MWWLERDRCIVWWPESRLIEDGWRRGRGKGENIEFGSDERGFENDKM